MHTESLSLEPVTSMSVRSKIYTQRIQQAFISMWYILFSSPQTMHTKRSLTCVCYTHFRPRQKKKKKCTQGFSPTCMYSRLRTVQWTHIESYSGSVCYFYLNQFPPKERTKEREKESAERQATQGRGAALPVLCESSA